MPEQHHATKPLIQGIDYVVEDGRWVFTRAYHLRRGSCCGSGCRHCPYQPGAAAPHVPQEIRASPNPETRGSLPLTAKVECCAHCGKSFACHAGQCWCDRVEVPLEALIEMRQLFERCVCPECLAHFAAKHRPADPLADRSSP